MSGRYGLDDEFRITPLSRDKYFTQRILNENPMYAENPDYVFMAQQAKERYSIERQIHMSMSHGSIETNEHGQVLVPSEDAFNIFQKIPGTPAYWKNFRNELYARMEQLGPFHVFFTMSCAEARWPCVLVEVLKVKLKCKPKIMYLDNYVSDLQQNSKLSENEDIVSEKGNDLDQENSVNDDNDLNSSMENELPKRTNMSWNGETETVLVYDTELTGIDFKTQNIKNKDPIWQNDREKRLKVEIGEIIKEFKEYEDMIESTDEDDENYKENVKIKEQMNKIKEDIQIMKSLDFNLEDEEQQGNLIEFIIQLEDKNNELKCKDLKYIATKLKLEERKKIMTLDDYLDRYLKMHSMSKTDFLKDHFLMITRIFDKRVHDFMATVMKAEGIEDYCFRIEFQLRGLPHIHGVAWLRADILKNCLNEDGSFKIWAGNTSPLFNY